MYGPGARVGCLDGNQSFEQTKPGFVKCGLKLGLRLADCASRMLESKYGMQVLEVGMIVKD